MKKKTDIDIASKMKRASAIFRKCAVKNSSEWLTDNFYILECASGDAYRDCGKIQKATGGSDMLPSLFDACLNICENGIIPPAEELIEKLTGACSDAQSCELLPLALTSALVERGAEGALKNNEILANSIKSLRRLAEMDFEIISERLNPCEPVLNSDPSGIYPIMSPKTKADYRRHISLSAKRKGISEREFAERMLDKARKSNEHIGKFFMPEKIHRRRGRLYLAAEIIFPALCVASMGILMKSVVLPFVVYFPMWKILRPLIIGASLKGVRPNALASLDPENEKSLAESLIVVSTLMPEPERARECGNHLENVFLSNRSKKIKICCLADLKSSKKSVMPEDRASIKAMSSVIDELNKKYSGGFLLAVRGRAYSETQREFTGRERKRGAITELIRAIKNESSEFITLFGDKSALHSTKYIIALDADTVPEFDGIRELIAVAEHPLNYPVTDEEKKRIVKGYGILVPKSVNRLSGEKCSLFSKIMSGESGLSVYESINSERYNDLFGETVFCGKGLINVDAYYSLMNDGMPKERILSHDILEGGILRAGYVPNVEMTDSIPQSPVSYFLRLERWIRGDWQNLPFIFGKNQFNLLSKFKLFDNLRRSITNTICFISILLTAFSHSDISLAICLVSIIAIISDEFISGVGSVVHGGFSALSALFYSQTLPAALGAFLRAFVSLAFSAREAFISAGAVIKALFRMLISKKNLLEWTTAAGGEKKNPFSRKLKFCVPAMISAFILLFFGSNLHKLTGFFLLFDIPLGLIGDRPIKIRKNVLSERSRELLADYSASAWSFFEEQCGRENNYLPPDNLQLAPARAVARRTSPTNIGLMLVSVLAARDLGFITTAEMCLRLKLTLSSVEKLEKYHGNLLNWYNTETLAALEPRFVSTVDSGNFVCSLVTLLQGIKEYAGEYQGIGELCERIKKLIDETDLLPMYNHDRSLFYIGIDPVTEQRSEGCYDLFMSEARMTSYYAVAKRIIPKKHWGAMGRIIVSLGRRSGLVSWTGTVFEYFMPEMFIPSPVGSVLNESLHFSAFCQRRRSGKLPFGVSESGFCAYDSDLNYQYKAHGVQKIGLRRGLDNEFVVSPYSSFLMLPIMPETAVKNLKRLENKGMTGKYGFYEAADYTRCSEKGEFSIVSSYMAHHVGMSIISADNALNGNCMQKRFMSDADMKGASCILEEKIPTGARAFKDIKRRETPRIRERTQSEDIISVDPCPYSPEYAVYSNGRMSCFINDCGTGVTVYDGINLNVRENDYILRPQGVFAFFVSGKDRISFTSALSNDDEVKYSCNILRDRIIHIAENDRIILKMITRITKFADCEIRTLSVENKRHHEPLSGKLIVYFEPCIEKNEVFSRHPAFSKLFIEDGFNSSAGCLTFRRRNGDGSSAVAIAAGFARGENVRYCASRESVLSSPNGIFSIGEKEIKGYAKGNPDCCCECEMTINIGEREKFSVDYLICADENTDSAVNTFLAVKSGKVEKKYSPNPFACDAVTHAISRKLLPAVINPRTTVSDSEQGFGIGDLWSLGISGDLPIITVGVRSADEAPSVLPYIRFNKIIRNSGISADLAIVFSNSEGYINPVSDRINEMTAAEGCSLMSGVKGGIHQINSARQSYESLSALSNLSAVYSENGSELFQSRKPEHSIGKIITAAEEKFTKEKTSNVKQYTFTDGKISIEKSGATVDIPWVNILSNKSFGTMVSDKALGFTWAINSGENKITPWYNDTMSDNKGERILLKKNGKIYDIAAVSQVEFSPEKAIFRCVIDGLKIGAEISVPEKAMVKKCVITVENITKSELECELIYCLIPVLGSGADKPKCLSIKRHENGCSFSNPLAPVKGFGALQCSSEAKISLSFSELFADDISENERDGKTIASIRKINLATGGSTQLSFFLSWGATEKAALLMPFFEERISGAPEIKRIDSGNPEADLFFNSFLYSQVKQCRFFGRTGFYQCSGAYGFRDQLQDSLAFLDTEPRLTKIHLLKCAAVQFEQGDVLHWWHVTLDGRKKISGIRTKCSDDLLWLPYVFCEYLSKTGDRELAEIQLNYIAGRELEKGEKEYYFVPTRSPIKEKMLLHCIRAVDRSLRFGENGLPLIGSCDWNDAISNAGTDDSGESVWLAMFQIIVLRKMSVVCAEFGFAEKSEEYNSVMQQLVDAVERNAWDGDRYIRAILKDGVRLGKNREFIDILPQAFAAFTDRLDRERVRTALNTAYNILFDEEKSVIKLLSPAFDEYEKENIGYIAAYPPGIRENAGQYSHGAVWLAMAMFKIGENEKAIKLLEALNPIFRYGDEKKAEIYRAEPYVMPGDVGIDGRAGWTHFTGSAAWMRKCISENLTAIQNHYKGE